MSSVHGWFQERRPLVHKSAPSAYCQDREASLTPPASHWGLGSFVVLGRRPPTSPGSRRALTALQQRVSRVSRWSSPSGHSIPFTSRPVPLRESCGVVTGRRRRRPAKFPMERTALQSQSCPFVSPTRGGGDKELSPASPARLRGYLARQGRIASLAAPPQDLFETSDSRSALILAVCQLHQKRSAAASSKVDDVGGREATWVVRTRRQSHWPGLSWVGHARRQRGDGRRGRDTSVDGFGA